MQLQPFLGAARLSQIPGYFGSPPFAWRTACATIGAPIATEDMMADDKASDPELEELIHHLQKARPIDFRGYKRTCLRRRILQRMEQVGCQNFESYRTFVDAN